VQTGKPGVGKGGADGFIDPTTKKERTIPLEIQPVKKDKGAGLCHVPIPPA
jgi:hypothetical protein